MQRLRISAVFCLIVATCTFVCHLVWIDVENIKSTKELERRESHELAPLHGLSPPVRKTAWPNQNHQNAMDTDKQVTSSVQSDATQRRQRQNNNNNEISSEEKMQMLRERRSRHAAMVANYSRPQIEEIIASNNTIIGDPQFLLDFAVIGFGKCGTSSIMYWLAEHPEVQSFRQEVYELMHSNPNGLVQMLYHELPPGRYKRGYKSPGDIAQLHILDYFRKYWPKTRLIIGIRHPIRWFESLYNFRVQNLPEGQEMQSPKKLIGRCHAQARQCCTEKGNFAYNLIQLGKFNHNGTGWRQTTELEEHIVGKYKRNWYNVSKVEYVPNPVFLFETGQLSDTNESRTEKFRRDFHSFMGLEQELPKMKHHKPGQKWGKAIQQKKDSKKIDICDEQWISVRRELLRLSRQGSMWIRNVFLDMPDVHVSSRPFFEELLVAWMDDPCGNNNDIIQMKGSAVRLPR